MWIPFGVVFPAISWFRSELFSSDYCLTVDQMPKILVWCFRFCTECVFKFPVKQHRGHNEGLNVSLKLTVNLALMDKYKTLDADYHLICGASSQGPLHTVWQQQIPPECGTSQTKTTIFIMFVRKQKCKCMNLNQTFNFYSLFICCHFIDKNNNIHKKR